MLQWTILVCAAFLAGVMNTLAGAGTFLTFPALTYCGVPPIAANATSALVVFPGYLTGAMGFRSELRSLDRRDLFKKSAIAAVGGLVGALLLLVSSKEVFAAVIPVLLSLATVTFALGDRLQAWARNVTAQSKSGLIGTLAVSIYGGYFNGGLGIMLLALFSLWGMRDLHEMNGLKSGLSFVISATSVVTFVVAGLIVWQQAVIMMLSAAAGGYLGAPLARALPRAWVRLFIVSIGVVMSGIFFERLWH